MRRFAVIVVMLFVMFSGAPKASTSPQAIAVLDTEARWVKALAARDAATVASILDSDYVHVNYRGQINYRSEAIAHAKAGLAFSEHLSGQTVNFVDGVAIVSGTNTVTQSGKVVIRLRYTDVYHQVNGAWKAVWSQETSIAP